MWKIADLYPTPATRANGVGFPTETPVSKRHGVANAQIAKKKMANKTFRNNRSDFMCTIIAKM